MANELTIRPMEAGDLDAVCAIEQASFSMPWSRQSMAEEVMNGAARYFVAERGGAVVGYGGLWLVIDEAHVTTIAVLPECRGQGIGRALMLALLDCCRDNGIVVALLEVRVSNTAAKALYKSLGFKHLSVRKRYYEDNGEDAAVMIKEV